MKLINSFNNILFGLYGSVKRFPAAIVSSVSLMTLLIIINETNPKTDNLSRVALALALAIPLSLCIKLFFERKDEKNILIQIAAYIVGGIFVYGYYLFFIKDMSMVTGTRYIGVSLALYMGFLFIPFFFKIEQFEMYVVSVFTGYFITVIYAAVLDAGLSAILFAMDTLLHVNILSKYYYYTFLFVSLVFAVTYFLSEIPQRKQDIQAAKYPRLLRILLLYIVMPLLSAYTVILYIYFGKIVITRIWPVGTVSVSHLVLWYAVIVTVVLFFITPIKNDKSWQKNFMRFAPKIIIPLLIMMFVSIGIRINAYGLTERRYYVVLLGIWLMCMMIYFSFFTNKIGNIIAPVTLAAFALIAVFGPLSGYSLSIRSQNLRFEQFLLKYDMVNNGSIVPSEKVSKEDKASISSIIDYFSRQHNLKDLKLLPKDFKINDMKTQLGFEYEYTIYNNSNGYFFYQRDNTEGGMNITGFDYMFDMRQYNNKNSTSGNTYVTYDYDRSTLKVFNNNHEVYSSDFNKFVDNIINNHGVISNNGKENLLPADEMTLTEENEKVKVKIIFLSISGNAYQTSGSYPKSFEFYVLVKIK